MSTGMSWPIYSMQLIPKSSSDQTLFQSVTSPKALGRAFSFNRFFRPVKGSGQSLRNGQTPLANHSISASSALAEQNAQDWKLRMEGQLFETGKKLDVTPFAELREYIRQELSSLKSTEASYEQQ